MRITLLLILLVIVADVFNRRISNPQPVIYTNVTISSYSWAESAHRRFGKKNCLGGDLTELVEGYPQCSADLSVYPLGTIVEVSQSGRSERRIVTDCGHSVRGPYHIDIQYNLVAEMEAAGTQTGTVTVLRRGWQSLSNSQQPVAKDE